MPDAEYVNLPSVVTLSDNRKTMLTLLEAKNLIIIFFPSFASFIMSFSQQTG
jgi:hypothetical protein